MNISAEKVAPLTVVLAVVGYCIWPSALELMSDPKEKPTKKAPELAATLFSPKLTPAAGRNPFAIYDPHAAALAEQPPKGVDHVVAAKPLAKEVAAAVVPESAADPLRGLKLEATCVQGDRWLAMINGRLYGSHDKLPAEEAAAQLKVVSVLPYKVTLERDGQRVELTYPNVVARAASAPGSAASAVSPVSETKATLGEPSSRSRRQNRNAR